MGVIPAGPNYATYGRTFRNTRGIRIQYRRLPMPLPCESTRIDTDRPPEATALPASRTGRLGRRTASGGPKPASGARSITGTPIIGEGPLNNDRYSNGRYSILPSTSIEQSFETETNMRYSPKHKEASRARLVEAGAALAKRNGFANTGMDALTAAAGVTTGAFYSQFRSKPEFLYAIVEHEMSKVLATVENRSKDDLVATLRSYLSTAHADHPELGCPVPTLGAEIARADVATRRMFEDLIKRFQASLATALHDDEAAWTLGCAAIGAVLVARSMASTERRSEVLRSVLAYTMRSFDADARKKK